MNEKDTPDLVEVRYVTMVSVGCINPNKPLSDQSKYVHVHSKGKTQLTIVKHKNKKR